MRVGLAGNTVDGLLNGEGSRSHRICGKMVEGLRNGNDPSQERDAFSLETMGVSLSIPSLMVAEDDLADLRGQACMANELSASIRMFFAYVGGIGCSLT